jgi:catechol 2,3-dioxygenase-like lactoylglutathione lyase family enzyme
VEMKLEVVVVPVSDVDRAKAFYESLGWRMDIDYVGGDDFRVVQFTPPGSECSIIIGTGITTAAPGSSDGLQLIVLDIEPPGPSSPGAASTSASRFTTPAGSFTTPVSRRGSAARTQSAATMAHSPPSATRTATAGCCRR